jgi:hypothetical protein
MCSHVPRIIPAAPRPVNATVTADTRTNARAPEDPRVAFDSFGRRRRPTIEDYFSGGTDS